MSTVSGGSGIRWMSAIVIVIVTVIVIVIVIVV